jgi:hypothetical protein
MKWEEVKEFQFFPKIFNYFLKNKKKQISHNDLKASYSFKMFLCLSTNKKFLFLQQTNFYFLCIFLKQYKQKF